jgi:AbrB family looped-hinge helix DNA binding protein
MQKHSPAHLVPVATASGLYVDRVSRYLRVVKTTISTKGQIILPAELREADGIEPGEQFDVERVGVGEYRLTRITPPPNLGVIGWLRSCPSTDWFTPVESESTDTL